MPLHVFAGILECSCWLVYHYKTREWKKWDGDGKPTSFLFLKKLNIKRKIWKKLCSVFYCSTVCYCTTLQCTLIGMCIMSFFCHQHIYQKHHQKNYERNVGMWNLERFRVKTNRTRWMANLVSYEKTLGDWEKLKKINNNITYNEQRWTTTETDWLQMYATEHSWSLFQQYEVLIQI